MIKDKIILLLADFTLYFNTNVSFVDNLEKNELIERIQDWLSQSAGSLVSKT